MARTAELHLVQDNSTDDLEAKLRKFAEFFVVDKDGEPVECWIICTEDKFLPESFFRKLIALLKKIGLFFHGYWTVQEGLSIEAEQRLKQGLAHLARQTHSPIWLAQIGG